MTYPTPLLVRALELARDHKVGSPKAVRRRLKQEGYTINQIDAHFSGRSFRRQIKALTQEAVDY